MKHTLQLSLLIVLCTTTGFAAGFLVQNHWVLPGNPWPVLSEAYGILQENGYKDLPDPPTLEYGMIRGMVQAYDDPYTSFLEPVQHELETNTLQGSFGGIGVRIGRDQDQNFVLYPIPGSPAAETGIQESDRLVRIDDLQVAADTSTEEIQAALRGPVGSRVKVEITRPPDFESHEFSIKRAEYQLPSVTWHIDTDEPAVGIVEINVVAASTPDEVQNAFSDLQSRGARDYVLDLRDNYGGLLAAGVDTARLFLKDGIVIEQQYRGREVETFRVEKPGALADLPIIVMVNHNTASAAEIIAGALKAHERARLIGASTYGKDTIQLVFDLRDGSSMHVTAAHWWIPNLEPPIAGVGIQPDIPLQTDNSAADVDPVLRQAVQIVLEQDRQTP